MVLQQVQHQLMQNLTVQIQESKQLVVLALKQLVMMVRQHHHLNHQLIRVVNKEMLIFQVLNQVKMVVFRQRMDQVHFYLKVVMLHSMEQISVVQVLQLMVSTVMVLIRLPLHFLLQI